MTLPISKERKRKAAKTLKGPKRSNYLTQSSTQERVPFGQPLNRAQREQARKDADSAPRMDTSGTKKKYTKGKK